MIAGLLLIGSVLGSIAATIAFIVGLPWASVALAYVATGVVSVLVISIGCAFRPRKAAADPAPTARQRI